jgi:hypothetical protein
MNLVVLVGSGLYAWFLERYKDRFEPNWTWVWVVLGVVGCVSAARAETAQQPGATWEDYERNLVRSFSVSGAVIIAWQLWRSWRRHWGELE